MDTTKATTMPIIRSDASVSAEAEPEFHQLQKACAEHDGNRQEKVNSADTTPADTDEQRPRWLRRSGRCREYRGDKLKQANDQGIPDRSGTPGF